MDIQRFKFKNRTSNSEKKLSIRRDDSQVYFVFKAKTFALVRAKLNAPHERNLENHVQGRCLCSGRLHFAKPTLKLVKKIILSIPPINSKTKSLQENQKDLETATETLSEYLERDISAENLVDIKQKVQDKYR